MPLQIRKMNRRFIYSWLKWKIKRVETSCIVRIIEVGPRESGIRIKREGDAA